MSGLWTGVVVSAYFVVPDTFIAGAGRLEIGGPHVAAASVALAGAVAGATAVWLTAFALGRLATAGVSLPLRPGVQRTSYLLATGFIALSGGSQLLAYAGVYTATSIAMLTIVLAAVGAIVAVRWSRSAALPSIHRRDWPYLAVSALAIGIALVGSLAPETEYDALWYHLWLPQRWLEAGRPVDIVDEYISLYPLSWDLAYGAALSVAGAGAAKLLHFGCLPLLAMATWLLCREIAPRASAPLAAAVTVTTPTVLWEATTAYVDLALAWYIALAAYALIRHRRTDDGRWLAMSALMLGGALAIKHLALVAAAILGAGLLVSGLMRHHPARAIRCAALFAVIALAVPAPWYARAYAAAANPVFPDLYGVFGASPPERWSDMTERGLGRFKARFGRERSAETLVALPWDVTMHGAQYGGSLGPLFLLLIPAAVIRRQDGVARAVLAGAAVYVGIWASPISSFQLRFLVPLVPFLAVLAASGAERMISAAAAVTRHARPVLVSGLTLLLAANLPPFIEWHDGDRHRGGYWLTHVVREVPLAVVTGAESRADYLRRAVPSYAAWEYIERHLSREARVLTFSGGDHFYSDRSRLWSDSTRAHPITWGAAVGAEDATLALLQDFGITHVLLDEQQMADGSMADLALLSPRMRNCCMVELYRDRRYSLHEIVSPDLSRAKAHDPRR